MRRITEIDSAIGYLDNFIQTVLPPKNRFSYRDIPKPQSEKAADDTMNDKEKTHAANLIRINHTGEVCAQALYQGQALSAKNEIIKEKMQEAALEEIDHLAWCEKRLDELDSRVSYLNPIWYSLSFLLGSFAGVLGDKTSLGFVVETERQVSEHLEKHLSLLPESDDKSRAILSQMQEDEMQHATNALEAGAIELPKPVKGMMRAMSKIMTTLTYRL